MKTLIDFMKIAITHLTNTIFRTGIYPQFLKTSRILPLQKPGKDEAEFALYHPLNNLNPIDKVVEECIRVQIDKHLMKNKIFPSNSHGSRLG